MEATAVEKKRRRRRRHGAPSVQDLKTQVEKKK
jgi:hypothetical protein